MRALVFLALCACAEPQDWTPEGEIEGTFDGLSNDCRCFGNPPRFSLSCAGSQIEIEGVEQRMVFDIEFPDLLANTRQRDNMRVEVFVGDMRGVVDLGMLDTAFWFGSYLVPDPRTLHVERYRVLGIDHLYGPAQAYRRDGESFGIERGPFTLTGVRAWCEDEP